METSKYLGQGIYVTLLDEDTLWFDGPGDWTFGGGWEEKLPADTVERDKRLVELRLKEIQV